MNSLVSLVLFGGLIIFGVRIYIGEQRRPKFRRIYGDPSLPNSDTWIRTDDSRATYSGSFAGGDYSAGLGGGCDGGGHGGGGGSC